MIEHERTLFLLYFFNSSTVVPLDCSSTSCGSQSWLTANPKYIQYFVGATCADNTPLASSICFICPSANLISPCTCAASTSYSGTVDISCANNNIGSSQMGTIISNIPATTPIGRLDLGQTGLILGLPSGLTKFTTISELNLAGNQIIAVNNGALAVNSSTLMKLYLSGNTQLATIDNSSLPRKC